LNGVDEVKKTILVVEDEKTINDVLSEYLLHSGYITIQAFDGLEGLMKFNKDVSLIILDIMIPKLNGFEVLKEIRKKSDIPALILSSLGDEENILKGYDLGVDEYISKPFSPKIIVKKVDAIFHRYHQTNPKIIQKGTLQILTESRDVFVQDVKINLTKKEYDILLLMAENEKSVFSRDALLNRIWGYDYYGADRVVDSCVKRLRKKMLSTNTYIKTVFGVGYKFEVDQDEV